MEKVNLRECIKRKIDYTKVTFSICNVVTKEYFYGHIEGYTALKKLLKKYKEEIQIIRVEQITEERYITLEDFIKHSNLM